MDAIFNDSYFDTYELFDYDFATEDIKESIDDFFKSISAKIKQIKEKNDIRVSDLIKCGYPKQEAINAVKKTAQFLNENGYVKDYIETEHISESSVISYSNLNSKGRLYYKAVLDTFKENYKKHGDAVIHKYIARARNALDKKQSTEKVVVFVVNLVIEALRVILKIGGVGTVTDMIPFIGTQILGGCAIFIVLAAIIDVGLITLIANYIINKKYEKKQREIGVGTSFNAMESVFDESYFDEALESNTGLKRGLTVWLGGPFIAAIYECIHQGHIRDSVVVDVNAMMMNGLSRDQAKKEAKKTIEWFKRQGFLLYPVNSDVGVLRFKDLNDRGQSFMRGFYDAIDDIQPIDLKKAAYAKHYTGNQTTIGYICALINYILASASVGFSIGSGSILGFLASMFDWGYVFDTFRMISADREGRKMFNNTYIEESVDTTDIFDDMYFNLSII